MKDRGQTDCVRSWVSVRDEDWG